MKRTILASAALAIALSACGGTGATGTVIEKDYDAATVKTEKKCKGVGIAKKCKTKVKRSPADWDITVRDSAGDEHEIEVSQAQYERVEIGDRWTGK